MPGCVGLCESIAFLNVPVNQRVHLTFVGMIYVVTEKNQLAANGIIVLFFVFLVDNALVKG